MFSKKNKRTCTLIWNSRVCSCILSLDHRLLLWSVSVHKMSFGHLTSVSRQTFKLLPKVRVLMEIMEIMIKTKSLVLVSSRGKLTTPVLETRHQNPCRINNWEANDYERARLGWKQSKWFEQDKPVNKTKQKRNSFQWSATGYSWKRKTYSRTNDGQRRKCMVKCPPFKKTKSRSQ